MITVCHISMSEYRSYSETNMETGSHSSGPIFCFFMLSPSSHEEGEQSDTGGARKRLWLVPGCSFWGCLHILVLLLLLSCWIQKEVEMAISGKKNS